MISVGVFNSNLGFLILMTASSRSINSTHESGRVSSNLLNSVVDIFTLCGALFFFATPEKYLSFFTLGTKKLAVARRRRNSFLMGGIN